MQLGQGAGDGARPKAHRFQSLTAVWVVGIVVLETQLEQVQQHGVDRQAAAVAELSRRAPEEAAVRRQAERNEDDSRGAKHDDGTGGKARSQAADDRPRDPADRAEEGGQGDHESQTVGPLPRRRCGRDDEGAHQDDTHRLQAQHDGDDHGCGHEDVDRAHRKAQADAVVMVERGQLELLEEDRHREEKESADGRHHDHVPRQERRGLAEEKALQTGLA